MKVLVADDSQSTRSLLEKLITSWGYEVVCVPDGDSAWELINDSDPPQIAVLDWNMPGLTGVEICSKCEEINLPVYRILLTSKESNEDIIYALDHGAHDFNSKPIVPGIMKSRLTVGKHSIESIQKLLLSERLAAVGTLVSGIAHHFNNINMPILMYTSSILNKSDLCPDIRKKVETIEKAAKKANEITETLMGIASNKQLKKMRVDLNALIDGILDIKALTFGEQEISIKKEFQTLPDVLIHESEIHHVVINLLENASHALIGSDNKVITLKTEVKNNMVHLKIVDNGCGIAATKLQSIFSPFYTEKGEFAKGHSPLSKVKGKGIGLYSSKIIATNHDGSIYVESKLDEGSTFTLTLPIVKQ